IVFEDFTTVLKSKHSQEILKIQEQKNTHQFPNVPYFALYAVPGFV
ncbi:13714_t:CDS:2, partial [Gigaspora margarita]